MKIKYKKIPNQDSKTTRYSVTDGKEIIYIEIENKTIENIKKNQDESLISIEDILTDEWIYFISDTIEIEKDNIINMC